MNVKKILIAGESWLTVLTHMKGFDFFMNADYGGGADKIIESLEGAGYEVDYIPNHEAPSKFPTTREVLDTYGAVILSDIGSNTLLLHPDTFNKSLRTPNRLKLLREWVLDGGALAMIGGYLTFQGIDGRGRWHGTAVEEVLPVTISVNDDRVEVPEGFNPKVVNEHPVLANLSKDWPYFLGYNKLVAKPDAKVLMTSDIGDPFLVLGEAGKGRTAAFASDCAPHWGSSEFYEWEYYAQFWIQLVQWLMCQR
jgi:uncharacterized membrane protein